jgi:hypothetical protein
MRVAIFITILFFSFNNCFGQTVYFSELQPEEWNTSLITNVEFSEGSYYVFGLFSADDIPEGTFIQRFTTEGILENTLLALDSVILPNYAENFNVYEDEIIFSGRRNFCSIDANGEFNWSVTKSFPELYSNDFVLSSKLESSDYLAVGRKTYNTDKDASPEFSNVYLLKVDTEGEEVWENEFNILPDKFVRITVVYELENGEFVLLGSTFLPENPVVIRVDSVGNLIDYSSFGQEEENNWLPWSVLEEENDRIVLSHQIVYGQDGQTGFDESTIAVSTYNLSTGVYELMYESADIHDYLFTQDFVSTPDGGYAVLGYRSGETSLPSFVHKINSNFEFEWEQEYNHSEDYVFNYLYDLEVTPDGGFVCAGETTGQNINTHPQSSWLLKLDACGDVEWNGCDTTTVGVKEEIKLADLKLYPNPAQDFIIIELAQIPMTAEASYLLLSIEGKIVLEGGLIQKEDLVVDLSSMESGIYQVFILDKGEMIFTNQFVKE